jgi:hypothetical protein
VRLDLLAKAKVFQQGAESAHLAGYVVSVRMIAGPSSALPG